MNETADTRNQERIYDLNPVCRTFKANVYGDLPPTMELIAALIQIVANDRFNGMSVESKTRALKFVLNEFEECNS